VVLISFSYLLCAASDWRNKVYNTEVHVCTQRPHGRSNDSTHSRPPAHIKGSVASLRNTRVGTVPASCSPGVAVLAVLAVLDHPRSLAWPILLSEINVCQTQRYSQFGFTLAWGVMTQQWLLSTDATA